MPYEPAAIEKKWQKYWQDNKTYRTPDVSEKPKYYVLDMFPYPSGAGLHVGHPKGYTATDITSRYRHALGYNVLHTMGWDAFGLPAENYAIKTGTHPKTTTASNIKVFTQQLQALGFSYDWDREIDTTDPAYYRWTQWIFLKLWEKGLAYEAETPVWWCPALKAVLANEEVVDGKSEVGGHPVERRKIRQWVLRITEYADKLLEELDSLDWPEGIKEMQRNWIGRSEGAEVDFRRESGDGKLRVFTTRVDTIFGVSFLVMAPDHADVESYITADHRAECTAYIAAAKTKSDLERTELNKEKTGVFTGSYVINPYSGERVPVWIADYVLGGYGTGAVMGVPAHDERDHAFATKYGLSIVAVVEGEGDLPREAKGALVNSGKFSGLQSAEAIAQMIARAEEGGFGERRIQYKLRDWIFSRQRYWGEPIPLVHLDRSTVDSLVSLRITHDNLERIRHGGKTLETRALNPDEPERYFGDIAAGQAIVLQDREHGTRHIVRVVGVRRWDDIETLYRDEASYAMLGIDAMEYGDFHQGYATLSETYVERIETHGMIGFEIEYVSEIRDALDSYVVADYSLPLLLPETPDYEPSDDGRSPLARIGDWVEVSLADNLPGRRETNTMPQWGASCWYYLRFMDPANTEALASREAMDYWGMVDEYVGGAEHAVLHLLYARFWHRALYDIGVVPTKEPFQKLTNVGLILGENNEKMSKSRGNVVNPNDVVAEYGADTLRLYEMFMGDFTDSAPWDTTKIIGMRRLVDRIYATVIDGRNVASDDIKAMKLLHKTVKKVGEDIPAYKFNTAISAINILVNEGCPVDAEFAAEWRDTLARLVHPFAPHIAEECWAHLGHTESVYHAAWPTYEAYMIVDDEVTIAIQVDGKLRTTFTCLNGVAKEEVLALAYTDDIVKKWTDDKEIVREIFVPNKLLNIVTKG